MKTLTRVRRGVLLKNKNVTFKQKRERGTQNEYTAL